MNTLNKDNNPLELDTIEQINQVNDSTEDNVSSESSLAVESSYSFTDTVLNPSYVLGYN